MAVEQLIGLDPDDTAIRSVELEAGEDMPRLCHMSVAAIPRGVGYAEAFSGIRKKLPHGRVATVAWPEEASVEFFMLPDVSHDEFSSSVRWEVARAKNIEAGDIVADFEIVGKVNRSDGESEPKRRVLVVHSTREAVRATVEMCAREGLELVAIDARETALAATLQANYDFAAGEPAVAVEIGSRSSFLVVSVDKTLVFTRRMNVSAEDLTVLLKESFDVEDAQIPELVSKCGVLSKKGDSLENQTILNLAAGEFAEKIVTEIRLAVDFCLLNLSENDSVTDLKQVYLSGSISKMEGLAEHVAEEMEIAVEVLDPLRKIDFDFAIFDELGCDQVPEMSVAMGLALRKLGEGS